MPRNDVVIVVPSRPIALRTLLAVMLAITLALSLIVPSGGAPAAAEAAPVDDSSLDDLGDLIEVVEGSVEFVEQPGDARLGGDENNDVFHIRATGTAPTDDVASASDVTIRWSYSRTEAHSTATSRTTRLLRDEATSTLTTALVALASNTFGTVVFATDSSPTLETAIQHAVDSAISTATVASRLDAAIASATAYTSPHVTAWDVAVEPASLTTTTTIGTTTTPVATAATPTVTTAFGSIEVAGPFGRRSVELRVSLDDELHIEPDWTFDIRFPYRLATTTEGTVQLVDPKDEALSDTATVTSTEVTVTSTETFRTNVTGDVVSNLFSLWDQAEDCTSDGCTAQLAGPVNEEGRPLGEVRVSVRSATAQVESGGLLLLSWLDDREVPGATGSLSSTLEQPLVCGNDAYQGLPGTVLVDAPGVEGEKLLTVQVPRSIVQRDTNNGRAQYDVCYLDETGLNVRSNAEVGEPFLLPTCGERVREAGRWQRATAPCIESRTAVRSANRLDEPWRTTLRGGLEIVIRLPAGDPMFR